MITHREPKVKNRSISWAKNILVAKENYVILDTETTGLKRNDVIIEIAVIDLYGNELFNSRIRPTQRKRISSEASSIHGIRMEDLKDCPTFFEIKEDLVKIIAERIVIIYNAEYDEKLLEQTCEQDDCSYLRMRSECAMIPYSEFKGRWSDYHYDYTFQRLPGGDHTAIGDCRATLKIIEKMAKTPYLTEVDSQVKSGHETALNPEVPLYRLENPIKKKWWEFWK
jgi:DNA polymerase III subunit epsilon